MTKRHPERRPENLKMRLATRERLWLVQAAAELGGGESDTARRGLLTWLEAMFPHLKPEESGR